jgi:uncharacterized Zn finger protein
MSQYSIKCKQCGQTFTYTTEQVKDGQSIYSQYVHCPNCGQRNEHKQKQRMNG